MIVELKQREKEWNGLIIPDLSDEKESAGVVVAAGPNCSTPIGTNVIISGFDERDTVRQEERDYVFVWQKDVICEVEGEL